VTERHLLPKRERAKGLGGFDEIKGASGGILASCRKLVLRAVTKKKNIGSPRNGGGEKTRPTEEKEMGVSWYCQDQSVRWHRAGNAPFE